ncbi:GMP synthase [glutamine-hydrolyzing] [Arenicella chitinivorans]|uniref:GMP synthase [glutamine-hydrolyzing] n=1 Tax=Arenicella chitinivorans TaxID=1329800 RepID=A0A918VMC5_9GAMM|nr:glutamine-hydrolyzing GMP synthase [Arenicella chitinivorans]GHA08894.1 GMP synthase [glutamine-hydrolyzing] [Arenicella chitinivorans]
MTDIHNDKILILDFGSQYTQLIARRIRELGVYCEIWAYDNPISAIRDFAPKGLILSGGPSTVTEEHTPRPPKEVFDLGIPVLGICYGLQCMAAMLGGEVSTSDKREFGHAEVDVCEANSLIVETRQSVWMSHGDKVTELPEGFTVIGKSNNAPLCAIADESRRFYGVQFHPEVTHSEFGEQILSRFVHQICDCGRDWSASNIIQDCIESARAQVGDDHVILGLSGGVDSSVVAALLHEAIGDQLTCIFVDNGLLRKNEGDQVMETFAENMGVRVIRVDAEDRFLSELAGVNDPEAKRKIIGRVFVEIFEEESKKIDNAKWLAQGTIYPDVIESAASKTGKAQVIKSHHNVGGLPEGMELKLLEPLRELFKDEVRRIGLELGLPAKMIHRHPFPGPGLGVRILGEVKKEYADVLREADAIFMAELYATGWYEKTSQAFAVFLPVKSVGVVGDNRSYDYVIALRAVQTVDFMTATWAPIPYDILANISSRIINEVRGISRVTYDISGKPPATIEWE